MKLPQIAILAAAFVAVSLVWGTAANAGKPGRYAVNIAIRHKAPLIDPNTLVCTHQARTFTLWTCHSETVNASVAFKKGLGGWKPIAVGVLCRNGSTTALGCK